MTDAPSFPFRLVSFDIDGTLVQGHGWEVIARARGREAEYRDTNRRFRSGEEGEDEHLRRLLGFAVGLSVSEMERLVAATPKVEGIAETLGDLRARGARVAVLSHNPEYVVDWYRRTYGFDDGEGTPGTVVRDGRIVDPGPAKADKLGGMRRLLERSGVPASSAAHVGDGTADITVFRHVGGGIAFNSTDPRVQASADRSVHSSSLTAVRPALQSFPPRRV